MDSNQIAAEGWFVISLYDGVTYIEAFPDEEDAKEEVDRIKKAYGVVRAIMPAEELLERIFGKEGG